jgi:hypothetical protein
VRKIAERFGVNPGTVQRISRPFAGRKRRRRVRQSRRRPMKLFRTISKVAFPLFVFHFTLQSHHPLSRQRATKLP